MLDLLLAQAIVLWGSPQFQELWFPVRILSSVSAMFWMLARLADMFMAVLRRLLPGELSALLNIVYDMLLSAGYAAMMFCTAFQGQWHPSLLLREAVGFVFMYIMLGVAFTDSSTGQLKPSAAPGFFLGVSAYLLLGVVPALARRPALLEFHRVLELFAAGGWGNVMTLLTVTLILWSLLSWAVYEVAFSLSPLLYRLRIIKAPFVHFTDPVQDDDESPVVRRNAVVASLRHSWFLLSLLAAGACLGAYWWPKLRGFGADVIPAIRSQAQSPETAAAALKLLRVLPAVSFTAVSSLPRQSRIAELARPVFRDLLSAPAAADRWLAVAALDRIDPGFSISPAELFRSTAAASLPCSWKGRTFQVLMLPLPGDDPVKARTYWISDDRGVHFSGVGPGEFREAAGAGDCALAAFGSTDGSLLMAFTETPQTPGDAPHLWLTAYSPERREVITAARVGENAAGNFALSAAKDGVSWADAPAGTAPAACSRDCGTVLGSPVLSLTMEYLTEYRSAGLAGGTIRIMSSSDRTFAYSGLNRNYKSLSDFELAFRFDPVAGFLNRWYRLARLADGRQCVSAALDPALPGLEQNDAWACGR
jgi:hypothetical protein